MISVETAILKVKIFMLMRHIHIPWLMAILLKKFMFHHQRIYYILSPWDLHMR